MAATFQTRAAMIAAFAVIAFVPTVLAMDADDQPATGTNAPTGRYGLFDGLDHRSQYTAEVFPEPFLIDDMAYEDNEIELTWLHTKGNGQQDDAAGFEFQKGFGLLTFTLEVPYERLVDPDDRVHGMGDIQMSARYPLYQYVSDDRFIDSTFGVSMEGDLPVDSTVSKNPALEPVVFNALKLGQRFTVQTTLGYSQTLGSGDESGAEDFECGVSMAYAFAEKDFRLPGVAQFIPMVEFSEEAGLNKDEAGQNSLEGDAGFRLLLKPVGNVSPGVGLAYVFPIDNGARQEFRWGFILSTTFEF